MDYRYAMTLSDRSRIDKLNKLTNPSTFWEDVAKFKENLVRPSTLNSWDMLARVRYSELVGSHPESSKSAKKVSTKDELDITLKAVECLIKAARTEQRMLDSLLNKLFSELDGLGLDMDAPTEAENVTTLDEAINCYVCYGEYSLEGLLKEIKQQLYSG